MTLSRKKPHPDRGAVQAGIARMRKFHRLFEAWQREHPGASAAEVRKAGDEIAARIMPPG